MNRKRQLHQSLIIAGRYLYVFFGMVTETLLSNSIECLDLMEKSAGFQDVILHSDDQRKGRFFDRPLFYKFSENTLDASAKLLIFGGFRGDCHEIENGKSEVFSLILSSETDEGPMAELTLVSKQLIWSFT